MHMPVAAQHTARNGACHGVAERAVCKPLQAVEGSGA